MEIGNNESYNEDYKIKKSIGDCVSDDEKQDKKIVEKKSEENCDFGSILVSKKDGKFDLKINPSSKEEQINTLEIIAGPENKKEIITVETIGLVGPCTKKGHNGKVFYTPFKTKSKSDNKLEFEVGSRKLDISKYFSPEFYWPRISKPVVYSFNANTCKAATNINVHVYPDIKWKAKLGFDMEAGFGGKEKSDKGKDDKKSPLEFSFTAESDGKTVYEISSKSEDRNLNTDGTEKTDRIPSLRALKYLWESSNKKPVGLLKDFWGKRAPGTLTFKCSPELNANWGWQEIEGSPKCDFAYGFEAKFDPLLEITGKIDFAGPLLFLIPPPVGPFLAGTKKLLEATETGEISAELLAQGSISIKAKGDKLINNPEPQFDVEGTGFVLAQFELRANLKFDTLIFSFGSGVKLGARAKFTLKDLKLFENDYGANLCGTVDFEGLKCYFRAYFKAGVSEVKSEIPDKFRKRQKKNLIDASIKDDKDNEGDGKLLGYIIDPYPNFYSINFPIIGEP